MLDGDEDDLVRTEFRQQVVRTFQVAENIFQRLFNSADPSEWAGKTEIQILY